MSLSDVVNDFLISLGKFGPKPGRKKMRVPLKTISRLKLHRMEDNDKYEHLLKASGRKSSSVPDTVVSAHISVCAPVSISVSAAASIHIPASATISASLQGHVHSPISTFNFAAAPINSISDNSPIVSALSIYPTIHSEDTLKESKVVKPPSDLFNTVCNKCSSIPEEFKFIQLDEELDKNEISF